MKFDLFLYYLCCDHAPYVFKLLSDEQYLKMVYRIRTGKKLDLENPKRFNEKLQWLKLNDRKPIYTDLVDKYKVRDVIKSHIGDQYLIPLLGVWDKPEEIDFDSLPNQFVLKCNHDSQGVVICKDKTKFDIAATVKKLRVAQERDFTFLTKEYAYSNVERKIIAEQYMDDGTGELKDYKVLCFAGQPRIIEVHSGRFSDQHYQDLYDTEWNKLSISQISSGLPNAPAPFEKPVVLEEMLNLSRILSHDYVHIRVDWYVVDGRLYFGELTFFDASGFDDFEPDEWNRILGDWIDLTKV